MAADDSLCSANLCRHPYSQVQQVRLIDILNCLILYTAYILYVENLATEQNY